MGKPDPDNEIIALALQDETVRSRARDSVCLITSQLINCVAICIITEKGNLSLTHLSPTILNVSHNDYSLGREKDIDALFQREERDLGNIKTVKIFAVSSSNIYRNRRTEYTENERRWTDEDRKKELVDIAGKYCKNNVFWKETVTSQEDFVVLKEGFCGVVKNMDENKAYSSEGIKKALLRGNIHCLMTILARILDNNTPHPPTIRYDEKKIKDLPKVPVQIMNFIKMSAKKQISDDGSYAQYLGVLTKSLQESYTEARDSEIITSKLESFTEKLVGNLYNENVGSIKRGFELENKVSPDKIIQALSVYGAEYSSGLLKVFYKPFLEEKSEQKVPEDSKKPETALATKENKKISDQMAIGASTEPSTSTPTSAGI